MTTNRRTEIYRPDAKQCYRCRRLTYLHELSGIADIVWVQRFYNMIGLPVGKSTVTQIVDVCPNCLAQHLEAEKERRNRLLYGISGAGIVLWGWPYLGPWSLVSAVGVVLCGVCLRWRRNRKALVVVEGRSHGYRTR